MVPSHPESQALGNALEHLRGDTDASTPLPARCDVYVGLGAVAVLGLFVRAVHDPVWWRVALTAAVAGFVALVRPTDSVLVIAPLFAIGLVVTRLRRMRVLAAVAIGELMAWLPRVIEGYLRFGGPVERLRAAETSGTHELV